LYVKKHSNVNRVETAVLQTLPLPDQPLLVLLLGGALAVAGGLPFLLLPRSLWRSPLHDAADKEDHKEDVHAREEDAHEPTAAAAAAAESAADASAKTSNGRCKAAEMQSPFQQHQQQVQQQDDGNPAAAVGSSSSGRFSWWGHSLLHAAWSLLLRLYVAADNGMREFCASSFLDTAVSGMIVVGLILGSVVLSVVLLVQVRLVKVDQSS
jgi:hypothetical protein